MNDKQFELYCQFIRVIMDKINSQFDDQKEYIHCKIGCAFCCQNGEYPCSQAEFDFLEKGYCNLDNKTKNLIQNKILKIKEQKDKNKDGKFVYECPFLINNVCSVYDYRMIICRTFGLTYFKDDDKIIFKVPFCMEKGLNYNEVYDKATNSFSYELFEKTGYKNKPKVFNLNRHFLIENFGKKIMEIDFGEDKTLLEWL